MSQHKLLVRQLAKASASDGSLSIDALLALVSAAYSEQDLDRRRTDRANALMTDELDAANAELRSVASAAALQNIRFQAALDNMRQGLCLFDKLGLVVTCNRRFIEMYGIDADLDPVGMRLVELLDRSGIIRSLRECERRQFVEAHAGLPTHSLSTVEQTLSTGQVIAITRDAIEDGGYLDTIDDITETRRALLEVTRMARHDSLTCLPNRLHFREHLARCVQAVGTDAPCTVAIIDLDHFKNVNDTLGHPVGDALLVEVSNRLRRVTTNADLAARLGGDEFAVVLRSVELVGEAQAWAGEVIRELSRPYMLHGHPVEIGASIGLADVTPDERDPDDIIRNADLALYKAKALGRGRHVMFAPEFLAELSERRQLELSLRLAVANNGIEVHYQPQIDFARDRIVGFEALARWSHPTRGDVAPGVFIPLAEECGLIGAIGLRVLERACFDALVWPGDISVSVNVSALQLRDDQLVHGLRDILRRTGLSAHRLELEVTESVMLQATGNSFDVLNELKAIGVKISLDDFGTGFSSLSLLRSFPFDHIKIDRSFVSGICDRQDSGKIISAISGLCRSMGIKAIAEGVETHGQLSGLLREEIGIFQGYLFGRAMPAAAAAGLFRQGRSARIS